MDRSVKAYPGYVIRTTLFRRGISKVPVIGDEPIDLIEAVFAIGEVMECLELVKRGAWR